MRLYETIGRITQRYINITSVIMYDHPVIQTCRFRSHGNALFTGLPGEKDLWEKQSFLLWTNICLCRVVYAV